MKPSQLPSEQPEHRGQAEVPPNREAPSESDFHERLKEVMDSQYWRFEVYRSLCEKEGVRLDDIKAMIDSGELHSIPAVPADSFKRDMSQGRFRELADFEKPGAWLVSSSTTGDPSYVWRTAADRQSVIDSFTNAYSAVSVSRCLAFSPNPDFLRKAGKRFALDEHQTEFYALIPSLASELAFGEVDFLTGVHVPRTLWTMIKTMGKGRPVLNVRKRFLTHALKNAERENMPVLLGSSILLLYPAIKSLARNFDLGKNVYFLTGGGGWDGKKGILSGQPINKGQYVREMLEKFGMPEEAAGTNFWDTFGTAENGKAQPGPFSKELDDFVFEVGADVKLYALDPVEGVAKEGDMGIPKFISPYGVEGFAGACVQQQDIIKVVSLFDDGSVRQFTHVHRATCAGCALDAADGVMV